MNTHRTNVSWTAGVALLLAAGCTSVVDAPPLPGASGSAGAAAGTGAAPSGGAAGSGASQGGSGPATGGSAGMPTPDPDGNLIYVPPDPAPAELRARTWRLSHAEYQKAVQAFVGAAVDIAELEPEIDNGVYPNMSASGLVRATLASGYYRLAEQVAAALTSAQLSGFVGGAALDAGARAAFIAAAVEKAFRRPPSAEDLSAFDEIFALGVPTSNDGTGGFRAVIRALLTSPYFLYRTEIGAEPSAATFTLTPHEVASLLSFSLLGEPPSADLLALAASGELANPATLGTQVTNLLARPEAAQKLATFLGQWLKIHHFDQIDKDASVFPGFEAIRPAMQAEAESFLAAHTGATGTIAALLTTPVAPTGALAQFYASEPSGGGAIGTRTGVLGLGAVVSLRSKPNTTSPTLRGLFVRERLLCQAIHLPADQPPDISETQVREMPRTNRELYELHASEPSCAGCHLLVDPVGFNFEQLDAAGRYRTLDNGYPIDPTGELTETDVNGMMTSHTDLANALSRSEWVRECVAIQAFRFYYGVVEAGRGVPAVQSARLAASSGALRDMVVAIMSSESSLKRVRN